MAAAGTSSASGASSFIRVGADGQVTGLPGAAYFQDGVFYDSAYNVVTPPVDVEFIRLKNSRTGRTRLITVAELATLLA